MSDIHKLFLKMNVKKQTNSLRKKVIKKTYMIPVFGHSLLVFAYALMALTGIGFWKKLKQQSSGPLASVEKKETF